MGGSHAGKTDGVRKSKKKKKRRKHHGRCGDPGASHFYLVYFFFFSLLISHKRPFKILLHLTIVLSSMSGILNIESTIGTYLCRLTTNLHLTYLVWPATFRSHTIWHGKKEFRGQKMAAKRQTLCSVLTKQFKCWCFVRRLVRSCPKKGLGDTAIKLPMQLWENQKIYSKRVPLPWPTTGACEYPQWKSR